MRAWLDLFRRFLRGLRTSWIASVGLVFLMTGFVGDILAELLRFAGVVESMTVGLFTYLLFPGLFIAGLAFTLLGWCLAKRRSKKTRGEFIASRFDEELLAPRVAGSRLVQLTVVLVLASLAFIGISGARTLHFMDQPKFCGTACHSVMSPEWATYQTSPHARVKCVQCHVGEGVKATIDAKINGTWQMISVTFDLLERPIPTPVHNLRPARETCEKCHWPQKFYDDKVRRIVRYGMDEKSTPHYTTLSLKVGSADGNVRGKIHWHVAKNYQVRYLAGDPQRLTMRWVEVKTPDGHVKRYRNKDLHPPLGAIPSREKSHSKETPRVFDCIDCHNRATHIYEDPEDVVDSRISRGEIDGSLPFAKRNALAALVGSYPSDKAKAIEDLAQGFRGFYQRRYPKVLIAKGREIDRAVKALQDA